MAPPSAVDTLVLNPVASLATSRRDQTTLSLGEPTAFEAGLTLAAAHAPVPPLPENWRSGRSEHSGAVLGAGIGLFGLRSVPLVDRDDERTVLWDALREVGETEAPRLVALTGPAGCGKSRLAEWLCDRAHEVGAAMTLRADHSPIPGTGQGLGPMLARFLRCQGLSRSEILLRVKGIFRAAGVDQTEGWNGCGLSARS